MFNLDNNSFSKIVYINKEIYLKNKNKEKLNFLDYFLFQATLYIISIHHESIHNDQISFTKCFLYRSLIECIAVIKMYLNGDIKDECTELLRDYNFIAEYNIYNKSGTNSIYLINNMAEIFNVPALSILK